MIRLNTHSFYSFRALNSNFNNIRSLYLSFRRGKYVLIVSFSELKQQKHIFLRDLFHCSRANLVICNDCLEIMLCSCANLCLHFPLDIDECKEGKDGCDKATTTCSNHPGTFRCDCKHGYGPKDRYSCQRKWKRI